MPDHSHRRNLGQSPDRKGDSYVGRTFWAEGGACRHVDEGAAWRPRLEWSELTGREGAEANRSREVLRASWAKIRTELVKVPSERINLAPVFTTEGQEEGVGGL